MSNLILLDVYMFEMMTNSRNIEVGKWQVAGGSCGPQVI